MSETPATHLPPCPTCKLPVHAFVSVIGQVSYQCNNDRCEHFPATAFHPREEDARAEWIAIVAANLPKTTSA